MISKKFTYAVIWASNNQEKFWFKVFQDLLNNWYKVIPINPNEDKILGEKCYAELSDYKWKVNVGIFVVPPQITEKILKEIKNLNIKNVWFQPWSESPSAIKFCEENQINYTANACIMIEKLRINFES